MNPFSVEKIPKQELTVRMAGSAVLAGLMALVLAGPMKDVLGFGNTPGFLSGIFNIPPQCLVSEAVNDFRRKQCEGFWTSLGLDLVFAMIPFVVGYLSWGTTRDQITGLYRKLTRKIDQGKAKFPGIVTDPAEAPIDFYGRFFLLRSISVELSNKSQMRVYQPYTAQIPLPGQTMAVFEHEKRHFGVLYAPEISVRNA